MSVTAQLQSIIARTSYACRSVTCWAVVVLAVFIAGCQTLSLPAIDTTGNRIFDFNRSLQWVNPHDPNNGYPSTAPAFQQPPTPPACVQTGEKKLCQGCLNGKGCFFGKKKAEEEMRGRCGELLITPNRLVAPVGGEVVILAGICGKDDNLVTNEAIEWMLSPDSVGQIVEVGDDAKGKRSSSFWKTTSVPKVEKLGVDFARGRTSQEPGVITKGTADQSDDLPIRKGQTWASLTSPSEGITKVTVLAPDSDVWNKRRQTATIYWIDASWNFPQPVAVSGDEPVTLDTKVLRSDNFKPAKGWIVRYRTLNPEFAKFVSASAAQPGAVTLVDTIDATVGDQGIASATMKRLDSTDVGYSVAKNGTAIVEVEIIRPEQATEDMPPLSLARANTSVTWSAPELVLNAMGPDVLAPGQQSQYVMKVYNIGSMAADNVTLAATIPNSLLRVDSTSLAPSQQTNQSLIWNNIGRLPARSEITIAINVTAVSTGNAKVMFDLSASPNIKQQKTVDTNVEGEAVSVTLAPQGGSTSIAAGSEVTFDCMVINRGNRPLNDVVVSLQSTSGLVHSGTRLTTVERNLQNIGPGAQIPLSPVFLVLSPGEHRLTATVTSMGSVVATVTASVQGVASSNPPAVNPPAVNPANPSGQPVLPPQSQPGVPSTNPPPGNIPLPNTNPIFPDNEASQPPALPFPGTTNPPPINPPSSGGAVPGLPELPPLNQSSARPAIGSGVATQERLAVSITPMQQMIRRGDTVTYEIRVSNLVSQPDAKVVVAFAVPKGGRLEGVKAQGLEYRVLNTSGIVEMTPIQFFRANDSYAFQVKIKHGDSPSQSIAVSARSQNQASVVSNSINIRVD